MSPLKLLHLRNPFWPTHFHHFSCTNPNRPLLEQPLEQPPITVTSRRTSTPSSSSLLLPASYPQQTTTNRLPPLPQPAVLFPQHPPIPHQPPTNNHMIDGNTSTSSPHPPSPCRNSPTLHLHFHPPSAAHRATGAPRHHLAQLPPPAPASRIHAPAPRPPTAAPPASTAILQLQSTRFQSDLHHHSLKPYNIMLPPNPFSLCPRQLAGRASKEDLTRLHHPWHHQQSLPHPRTRGQHIVPFQHSNPSHSSHHRRAPPTWAHHPQWSCSTHPRPGWTRRGTPCQYHNHTMTPLPTRGMQTTSDHAAAASEAPVMISPRMIHTIFFLPSLPPQFSYVGLVLPQLSTNIPTIIFGHWLSLLRRPTRSVSLRTTKKQRVSVDSQTLTMVLDPHGKLLLSFLRLFCVLSCFPGFSSFGPSVSDSMTVLTPLLLPLLTSPTGSRLFSLLKSTTGAPRPRSSDTSPSHHGRAVAAILLESLFDAATSSAAHQPRYHNFSSHHRTPHLQPHRHLRPTHSRTSYTPRPPLQPLCDSTVHTAIAAYTPTPGIHLTAGVSTSATATPANGRTRHSTTIDFPTPPTATTHHTWQHSASATTPTHPIPHTACARLLEPN